MDKAKQAPGPWELAESNPLVTALRRQAAAERRIAQQYVGCSWVGDMSPSAAHNKKADLLEQAAEALSTQSGDE